MCASHMLQVKVGAHYTALTLKLMECPAGIAASQYQISSTFRQWVRQTTMMTLSSIHAILAVKTLLCQAYLVMLIYDIIVSYSDAVTNWFRECILCIAGTLDTTKWAWKFHTKPLPFHSATQNLCTCGELPV